MPIGREQLEHPMARRRRCAPSGAVHHVTNRANRRHTIFKKPADYSAFLKILREAGTRFHMRLIGFCVMPNHFHLILWPPIDVSLSEYMHWVTSTHVRRYHEHYGLVGTGHLYQARFGNRVCPDDRRLLSAVRYVEANPLRAKLVERAEEWQWSSLWLRVHGDLDRLLCECPVTLPPDWSKYIDATTVADE
jgi:putative transposase